MDAGFTVLKPHTKDLGGFQVRRLLPGHPIRMVGPFVFFDHMGPATFPPGGGVDVRPHPHIGLATVTYLFEGALVHRDSLGSVQRIAPGDVNWMTAGRGIVHSEMPEQEQGRMRGFQLWVNLPSAQKMTAPRYQEYGPDRFPETQAAPGVWVKVIAGSVADVQGAISQPATDPVYLDLRLDEGATFEQALPDGHAAFAYVYEGAAAFGSEAATTRGDRGELLVFGPEGSVRVRGLGPGTRLILVAGRPLREPVARYGPFVMNTQAELRQAFEDFQAGRF